MTDMNGVVLKVGDIVAWCKGRRIKRPAFARVHAIVRVVRYENGVVVSDKEHVQLKARVTEYNWRTKQREEMDKFVHPWYYIKVADAGSTEAPVIGS